MPRLHAIDPAQATGLAKDLLDQTQAQLGRVPNLYRAMANAPAALDGYLQFRASLLKGQLGARVREQLALAIAESNDCGYCVSAHVFRGRKMGIEVAELEANRRGQSADPKTSAALGFAQALTRRGGEVSGPELARVREAGWSDLEIGEIAAHVALNSFSNLFSHLAQPELDFPPLETAPHA